MMDLTGRTLGKYQVGEEIGRGGMGAVYRGHDPILNRTVAIKIMAPHLAWEKQFVDRFLREARTVARLDHPHIVAIYDVGEQDGVYYLVMAFVEGESLGKLLAREGKLAPEQAARLVAQVASALDYAHNQGVIHRDVKPANILLTPDARAILTDFGIAHALDESRLTAPGATMGTPEYMSPEQAQGQVPDARSDVYSLGIVLYQMLTGRVPFRAETPMAVLHMQATAPPRPPRSLEPTLPPTTDPVLARALAKDPANRYARAGELAAAIRGALAGRAPAATAPRPAQPAIWPWVLLLLVLVLVVIGGGWLLSILQSGNGSDAAQVTVLPSGPPPAPTASLAPPTMPVATPAPSSVYIEYVLGASNSMMQPLAQGQTRLDAARSALSAHLIALQAQPHTGLRAYGHRLSAADEGSCLDTELLLPLAQGQQERMLMHIHGLAARGMAPLNEALIEASADLGLAPGRTNALILIADGGDSCGKDPCRTVSAHQEVGAGFPIYVAGLAVDEQTRQQLVCLAESSGGTYRDVANETELRAALDAFVQQILNTSSPLQAQQGGSLSSLPLRPKEAGGD